MLNRPTSCEGCPLHPLSSGFMRPSLAADPYGVALVGEALGADEAEQGQPFVGKAGFKLTRLIEWAGLDRARFDIWNVAWCRPPFNKLEGEEYETGAISHCRSAHWQGLLSRPRVLVPMGNVATNALLGRKQILRNRGYIWPGPSSTHVVPTVHPSFIQRGQSKYSAAFINDIQKAVRLASEGLVVEFTDYLIDPTPRRAYEWAQGYRKALAADPTIRLAYDIETPGKGEDEGDVDGEDASYFIWRVGFSFEGTTALTVPFTPEYLPAIRLLLDSVGEKVVWNAGFDNPRLARNGVEIKGLIHDGMVAWHILHSDLPKGLGFVATFTCPHQSAWKHLSVSSPGFYNCTDADVELRSFQAIEAELKRTGLWEVYERDVLELDPILVFMTSMGMPIDAEVRYDRAKKLTLKQRAVLAEIERQVPQAARRLSPEEGYVRKPAQTDGMVEIRVEVDVERCSQCGVQSPPSTHFTRKTNPIPGTEGRKKADREPNPCFGGGKVSGREEITRFANIEPFKPSREQLIRYHAVLNRPNPTIFDKKLGRRKVSFNEKSIKGLIRKYPADPLYKLVLEYRELDKLGGTYIGRVPDETGSVV